MSRFLEFRSVLRDLRKHVFRAGKVTAATLKVRTTGDSFTSVAWKYAYLWPLDENTGLGGEGYPTISGRVTLWRAGETSAPRADDQVVIGSKTYLIVRVQPRLNGDESSNFAVYDCQIAV